MKENLMEIDRAKEPYTYITISSLVKMGKQIERLQEQLKEANDLLKAFYDDSPCRFDHLGYCQEHGSTDGNYICVQGELKEYLERYGVK